MYPLFNFFQKRKSVVIILFFFTAFVSCKKDNLKFSSKKYNKETSRFFANTEDLSNAAKKVVSEFRNRTNDPDFITKFIQDYGYPVWNKSISVTKRVSSNRTQISSTTDSIIVIPVLQNDGERVNAYISAGVYDSVIINIHTSNEYSLNPFSNSTDEINIAEKIAMRFMLLEKEVFGHKAFLITDKRLFHGSDNYSDTGNVSRKIHLNNSAAAVAGKFIYVSACISVVTSVSNYHCNGKGRCVSGTCDLCSVCVSTSSTTSTVCDSWWDDDGGGANGGGTGGGTGSSGGGGTNPCGGPTGRGNSPCNPGGGGGGWVPIPADDDDYFPSFYAGLNSSQQMFWDNPSKSGFKNFLFNTLEAENYSPAAIAYVKWAINFLLNDNIITPIEFANYFNYVTEAKDGNYNSSFWDNPNLTFQQASLPTFQSFISAFPKITLSNGAIKYMSSSQVYTLVGGNMDVQNKLPNANYQNACAIRGSRALNYCNSAIDNTATDTELGSDGKRYILNAKAFNKYMNKKYGPPTYRLTKAQINGDPTVIANFLRNKNGIYNMVTNGGTYSGHVDLIISGICLGGAAISNVSNVEFIEIWTLP